MRSASPPIPPGRRMPPAWASTDTRQTCMTGMSIPAKARSARHRAAHASVPRRIDAEQCSQHPEARMAERRGDPRLAPQLRALRRVDAHVARPQMEDACRRPRG